MPKRRRQSHGPDPATGFFILRSAVAIGKQPNHTTVSRPTSQPGISIEMSFLAERPPIPSKLFVHCPNLDTRSRCENEMPIILSMADDFFLVRFVMMWPGRLVTREDPGQQFDYFVYNPTLGILDQLPHPHPLVFYPHQVGLLPRGDKYTVAALIPTCSPFMYDLCLFHSDSEARGVLGIQECADENSLEEVPDRNAGQMFWSRGPSHIQCDHIRR
jgi:hypothetical protein